MKISNISPSTLRVGGLWLYVALAWGGSFVAIKTGLSSLPPVFFAATRLDIAAAIVLPIAWFVTDDVIPTTRKSYLDILVTGVFVIGLTTAFLYAGQQYATSAVGAVLMALNPILAGGFAWILLPEERPDVIGTLGLLLGLVGISITAGFRHSALLAGEIRQFYLLLAAVCIAFGSVISRRVSAPLSATSTAGWGTLFAGILLHIVSLALNEPVSFAPDVWTPSIWISVAYVGVIATGGAYPAYFMTLKQIGPVKTNLVSYAAPLVAAVVGWLILGEKIEATTVVGFLVVITGFILVNYRAVVRETRDVIIARTAD